MIFHKHEENLWKNLEIESIVKNNIEIKENSCYRRNRFRLLLGKRFKKEENRQKKHLRTNKIS